MSNRRFLVVEQSATARVCITRALAGAGFEFEVADGEFEAARIAAVSRPDLILLGTTRTSGEESIKALSEESSTAEIPVLLVTSRAPEAWQRYREHANVLGVVAKPFTDSGMVATLEFALRKDEADAQDRAQVETVCQRVGERPSSLRIPANSRGHKILQIASMLISQISDRLGGVMNETSRMSRSRAAEVVAGSLTESSFVVNVATQIDMIEESAGQLFAATGAALSFADAIQSLGNRQLTGVLAARGPRSWCDVYLESGRVLFVNPRHFQLRRPLFPIYCAGRRVPVSEFQAALDETSVRGGSVFLRLVDRGVIRADDVYGLMVSFGFDVLRQCILIPKRSRFEFSPYESLPESFYEAQLNLSVQKFLLNLCSRMDEWKIIEEEILSGEKEFGRIDGEEADAETIGAEYARILEHIEEGRSVREIVHLCSANTFDVCRGVYALLSMGLIGKQEEAIRESADTAR